LPARAEGIGKKQYLRALSQL